MSSDSPIRGLDVSAERIAELESRIARIEGHLGIENVQEFTGATENATPSASATVRITPAGSAGQTDDFELALGRSGFALAGILALTVGVGILVWLPHQSLPTAVPPLIGYGLAGALLVLAYVWRQTFEAAAGYMRGAAMVLFFVATLRWFFPPARAALDLETLMGQALLVAVVATNLGFALQRKLPWLFGVALVTGASAVLAVGSVPFVFAGIVALALLAVIASWRRRWPMIALAAIPLCTITYLLWALGRPWGEGAVAFVSTPRFAPALLLLLAIVFSRGFFGPAQTGDDGESAPAKMAALANCALGYGLFFIHSFAAFRADFVLLQGLASVVFLGLAVASWIGEHSRIGTFFYAMTGHAALSMAILKGTAVPEMFVWLSLQSVGVVATAIWFRSRLIVVANFLIYVLIVLGYILAVSRETGASIGFGFVALLSARILNWQQHRLELKTELMRNAYLLGAFILFPYALAHLVPAQLIAVTWVGLALSYYGINLMVKSPKYRWMGHATLLLTTVYVVFAGVRGLDPLYRVLSFLALGAVLLIVSLSITRARRKQVDRVIIPPV